MKKKTGFTLAEVILVIVILGIISVITVSSVVSSFYEKKRVTSLNKAVSSINNALLMAVSETGVTPTMTMNGDKDLVKDIFMPTLKIAQHVENGFQMHDGMSYFFVQNPEKRCTNMPQGIDLIGSTGKGSEVCYFVILDTDSTQKGENQVTVFATKKDIHDRFVFVIYENGATAGDSVTSDVMSRHFVSRVYKGGANNMLEVAEKYNDAMTDAFK